MPRHRIHHGPQKLVRYNSNGYAAELRDLRPGDEVGPGEEVRQEPSFDLHWNKEGGWVQISIELTPEYLRERMKEVENSPGIVTVAIFSDVMARKEINDTISALRRARDIAYGADA